MEGSAKTVLIVDDSAQIRNILRDGFEAAGFSVCSEAVNGKEALAEATKHRPDLIILDQSMPEMTGLEAAPKLRQMLPNTPIVLFTFYGNEVSNDHAQSAGITSIVTKPNLDELISKAESHLKTEVGSERPQKSTTLAESEESKRKARGSSGNGR